MAGAAGIDQANGLPALDIEQEEGLGLFGGPLLGAGAALHQVAFGKADEAMGVQREGWAGEVTAGPAQLAQADLQALRLGDGVSFQQVMQGAVGGQPGPPIEQFKALVAQGTVGPHGAPAEGRFMDQVEGQAWGQGFFGAGPGAQQIPGAQAQVFGDEPPETQQAAGDLIGQCLTDLAFDAGGVAGLETDPLTGALGGQGRGRVLGVEEAEFFFEGRNRRGCAGRGAG